MSDVNPFEAPEERGYSSAVALDREYGGIGRLAYFGLSFLVGIVNNLLQFALMMAEQPAMVLVVILVAIVVSCYIVYLRLQNLGYSGWWVLGFIVPILNILVGLRCLAAPEGYADHKTLDTPGKVIIGLFLGLIAFAVLMLIVAVSLG